ncbi:hypothetical protein [Candidatus Vondammii sp. HM_W22]|uniref:hypothetical protein n=1 Tax=Candidatus Vondammii sp. HM_W22 TaxID=2687299 RepID=UPI001F1324D7|nr:hypothetical protein [Candidatus Vondammii sp. HM_W22]
MIDFTQIGKNCDEVGNKAAAETHRQGRPTVGWDKKKRQVIRRWPDGRTEVLEHIESSQAKKKSV